MKSIHEVNAKKDEVLGTDYITGCAMLVRAEVFRKIGLFDEDFFLYWEDVDFSLRTKKAGFKSMVVSNSWVYHAEQSERENKNKLYWLVFSGLLFFKKNTPWFLKPWIALYICMRKIKNTQDIFWKKNEHAEMVKKAYVDFKNAKTFFK
jgi:hypothetical protein